MANVDQTSQQLVATVLLRYVAEGLGVVLVRDRYTVDSSSSTAEDFSLGEPAGNRIATPITDTTVYLIALAGRPPETQDRAGEAKTPKQVHKSYL
jgi:hypothetical protein